MQMTSRQLFRRLLAYSLRYWPGFAVAILAMVVTAATETAFPAMMKPLIDKGFEGASSFQVWWVPVGILLIFITRGAAGFASSYLMQWIAHNVLRDLRQAMFAKLLALPSSTIDARSSGQFISRIITEVNGVTASASNVLTSLVRDSLILIGLLAWLFWISWKLTIIVLILLPILGGLTVVFSKRMRRVSRQALAATSELTRSVEQAVSGSRVIKIFAGEATETNRFAQMNAHFRRQAMRLATANSLQSPVSQFIAAIGVAAVLTIALMQSRLGAVTIGDFVSYVTAMLMMFGPLRHLTDVNAQLQRGLAAAEAVFSLIDEKSERDTGTQTMTRSAGAIAFEDVSLIYPNTKKPVLNNIDLSIKPGETVALVGPSGGGKTSIANLLPRLYDPSSGRILLDGIPVDELTLASLRQQFALVSQDVVLFNDSVRNNIIYGAKEVSEQQLQAAVDAADLRSFVDKLPAGLDTEVGDRGIRVSGGQRQRIAIARAIIKNAPILILDEATSALDNLSETRVKAAIDGLRKGRTTLVIAHRLSTILDADRIVVIDSGSILEQGSHEELLAKGGLYAELYKKQLASAD